ncbi:MAG TPA: sigma-54-dependent Fis family transcriptional regulator, partial [Polyangiaceae bacterium]|nr:sigma-54-dependent Fis family transcriptional regulator [Polyangiaceae bacterium]
AMVRRLAESHVTVLVLGETGTGKERVARAMHVLGPRASGRFVAVNCSAIPAELLESELFGHARGAFTGAGRERAGLFEEASGGTLFLDEIGDMPLALQAKLTRVLEERAVRRLGESRERPVDVRIVAATHRDLAAMVEEGTFREDLWYRMNVAALRLPALRERPEDIEPLALHFLEEHERRSGKLHLHGFAEEALDVLRQHDWPGNIRQLRAAVDRACVVATGDRIRRADLPPELTASDPFPSSRTLQSLTWAGVLEAGRDDVARRYLAALLRAHRGRVTEAAAQAGVERESFYRLCRKHGVHPAAYRR